MEGQTAIPATSAVGLLGRVVSLLRGEGMGSRIARGASWAFAINVLGTGIAIGVQVLLARTLGAADYGIYLYVLGWLNVVLLVAKFDFDNSAVRFVGAYAGTQSWPLLRGFLRRSQQIVVTLSVGTGAVAALAVWLFRTSLPPALATSLLVASMLLPATALLHLTSAALQGYQRVPQAQAPNGLLRPLIFGAILAMGALLWKVRFTPAAAVALNLVATAAALVVSWLLLRRALPAQAAAGRVSYATGEWWRVAAGLLMISASEVVLSQQADIVVVGSLLGTTQAGLYGAASQISLFVQFGVTSLMFIVMPMIAQLYAQGRRVDLQRLVTVATRVNLVLSLPVFALLVLGGRLLLGWYGEPFVGAYPVLVLLGFNLMANAVLGIVPGYLMSMTGHQKEAARIIGGCALLHLGLTFALTARFGLMGTATATLMSHTLRSLALIVFVRTRLRIDPLPFSPRFGR